MTSARHSDRVRSIVRACWSLGLAAAVWWLYVWKAAGTQVVPYINGDALAYWVPLQREVARQWRSGMVPLWNPYQALGTPLLATQQIGALYPLSSAYLLLPFEAAWGVTTFVHQLIAAVGMYLFCRTLRMRRAGCLVGAASYAFAPAFLGRYLDQPQFLSLAWVPALFVCAERVVSGVRLSAVVVFACVWALQILAGHPEVIAYTAVGLGAYVSLRVLSAFRTPVVAVRCGALCGVAALLALALSAAQLLPTLELLRQSVRTIGQLTRAQQSFPSAAPRQVLLLAQGAAPLALAALGLMGWRRRGDAWFFGGMALVLAVLATGPATPLFDWLRRLPVFGWFRGPVRVLCLWPFCLATLSAAGTDALLEWARQLSWRRAYLVVGATVAPIAARVFGVAHDGLDRAALVGIGLEIGPLLVLAWRPASARLIEPLRVRSRVALLLGCTMIPAFVHARYLSPFGIPSVYSEQAEVFARLRTTAPARVLSLLPLASLGTWAKLGTYFEVPVLNDLEPLTLADFRAFAARLGGDVHGMRVFMGQIAPPVNRLQPRLGARFLNLSGTRFVLAGAPDAPQLPGWFSAPAALLPWMHAGAAVVYENRAAQPRAFFVAARATRSSGADCVEALSAPGFDPTREALLDHVSLTGAPAGDAASSDVRISGYEPREIQLTASAAEPGVVIVSDAFYPGWQAFVDGAPVPIVRADCFFRAVRLEPGTHTVVLRYVPRSFALGASISLTTLLLVCVIGARQAWR